MKIWSPDAESPFNASEAVPFPEGVTTVIEPEELEKVITVPAVITVSGVVQVIVFSLVANGPLAVVH